MLGGGLNQGVRGGSMRWLEASSEISECDAKCINLCRKKEVLS